MSQIPLQHWLGIEEITLRSLCWSVLSVLQDKFGKSYLIPIVDHSELHRKTNFVCLVNDLAPGVDMLPIRNTDLYSKQLFRIDFSAA